MDPTVRFELRPGEWREDPPRVSYGSDRNGLVALLRAEMTAAPWTHGESDEGPALEVKGRTLGCPPAAEDLKRLVGLARPAPYGRGEETLVDPDVRDALQIDAREVRLEGQAWQWLRWKMLRAVAKEMGLRDAKLELKPLKLLVYRKGGHFSMHADTEKTPGMVASLALVLPGEHTGGALTIEHAGERLSFGADGSSAWRWAAWYADCRHALEPVEDGVRIALTFGIAIDPETPLTKVEATDHRIRRAIWGRTSAEWHTAWAARGARTRAGNDQYGQKLVWALAHRYTDPGLRGSLLKGRNRELARLVVDETRGDAVYLAWLQIREVGSAMTPENWIWGDHGKVRLEPDGYVQFDDDPPPDRIAELDFEHGDSSDPAPMRIVHIDTPELHLDDVARQNTWVEGLRSLSGDAVDHGPIEVLDGEIVPEGALQEAAPAGARLYEATGNEGASLELQYRRAVLVVWRRNEATLRMLARCGGRLALAVELAEGSRTTRSEHTGGVKDVLELWRTAIETDGGGPDPRAHRLMLEVVKGERMREEYVERVARVDLDQEAAPALACWFRERLEAGKPVEAWIHALGQACTTMWSPEAMSGAPGLLRALCERPETQRIAIELLADRHDPPATVDEVLAYADELDVALEEWAWRRRRTAAMTMDDAADARETARDGTPKEQ